MSVGQLRSTRFRKERERHWRELARLVDKVERGGVAQLTSGEVARLPGLYRQTLSALSAARAISLDRNLLDFLGSLAARASSRSTVRATASSESLVGFFGTHFLARSVATSPFPGRGRVPRARRVGSSTR